MERGVHRSAHSPDRGSGCNKANLLAVISIGILQTSSGILPTFSGECWNISTNNKEKVRRYGVGYLTSLMKIPWTDRKTNEEVLQFAGVQRSFDENDQKRQMKFLGQTSRKSGIEKLVLCGNIEGRRSRGRERNLYIDSLTTFATKQQITNTELIHLTENRENWRALIINASTRSDT